ncbi:MAG TPA: hypothetical protein VKC99_03965 [Methyloceanibacter sp.]|nr:hypothetical protein [Methyloceanibacter sp.]
MTAAALMLTTAGLALGTVTPAQAEFEIQEAGVEKGAKELEYRGAVHWGISMSNATEGDQADEGGGDEEEGPLRQSHDLEFEYGLTDRSLFSATISADEPVDQDFNLSSVELGLQYEFMKRRGDGIAMAIQTEYGFAARDEAKNEGGENDNRAAGSPNLELSFNVGVQFGLTDATSDGALKFQGTFSW